MDPTTSEAISQGFKTGILNGTLAVLKGLWWLIPLALLFRWINKKTDKWGKGKNGKLRGFSNK